MQGSAGQSPRFVQRLLAAEVAPAKGRVLFEELGPLPESEAIQRLLDHASLSEGERKRARASSDDGLEKYTARGIRTLSGDDLPERMLETAGTPPALFVHGDPGCLFGPTIGIVGTRTASTYGKACAHKFAEAFARAGVTVISGGALGIDAAAHRGALEGGGSTVAVLAAGVDNVYPAVHAGLFQQIQQSGSLVSQFPLGSRPGEYRFLVRNALVAALSEVLLVIEAPLRSGSMRTAHAAAEYGRDVFVVPASIEMMSFAGSFSLIRDGASLVTHPDEVLEAMGVELQLPLPMSVASSEGDRILSVLSTTSLPTEAISERTGMDTSAVLAELTMLELDGRVVRDTNGYALKP